MRSFSSSTKLYCLIGDPVSGSLSPQIHNAAYEVMGLDAVYLAFRVSKEKLSAVVDALRVLAAGFNVTIPHKVRISLMVDDLTQEAQISGSVNTVRVDDGRLTGHNTDSLAAAQILDSLGLRGGTATIVGAGGAAKSVLYALWLKGFRNVYIVNRSLQRAEALAVGAKAIYGFETRARPLTRDALRESLEKSEVLVNATPLGMYGGELDVAEDILRRLSAVIDLAYKPGGTGLERKARRLGVRVVSGLEFLVLQAALAIEFWTGRKPPVDVMMRAAGAGFEGMG